MNFKAENWIFQFLLLFLFYDLFLHSQSLNENFQNYLNSYRINKNIPSISAGISSNGKIIWQGSSGFADLENQTIAMPKTVYRIASISKSITAVALMQLVEQGKVNLNDDIRKYISNFPKKRWRVSLRNILNHTSGIRNYKENEFDSKNYFNSISETIEYIKYDSLKFEPGTNYLYSTLSYNLLAGVIEKVSGLTFDEYLQKNIFEPADMNSTYVELYHKIVFNRARGYVKNKFINIENAPLADLSIKPAGGGLISTTEDLLKFSIALLNEKLIKKTTLDSMLIPLKLKNGASYNYGLGFILGIDSKGRKFFSHSGTGTGFASNLIIYPNEKITSVHLINLRDKHLDNPSQAIIYAYLDNAWENPKKSLCEALLKIVVKARIDSAISFYHAVKKDSSEIYFISKEELKELGYNLLSIKKIKDAIIVFKTLLVEFPEFIDAYIGLGDAFRNDNNSYFAIQNYRKALTLDRSNSYCLKEIIKLKKK